MNYDALKQWEGSIAHLYLDSVGKITVGRGHLCPTLHDALAINGWVGIDSLPSDYRALQNIAAKNGPVWCKAHGAKYYEGATIARLPQPFQDALFDIDLNRELAALRKTFPAYDSLPDAWKLGLADMAFNLGGSFLELRNADGNLVWSHFRVALNQRDGAGLAQECQRKDIAADRNTWTQLQFSKG